MVKKIIGITALLCIHTVVQAKPAVDTSLNGYWSLKESGSALFMMDGNSVNFLTRKGKIVTSIPVTKQGEIFQGEFQQCQFSLSRKPEKQAEIALKNCSNPNQNKVDRVYRVQKPKYPIDYKAMSCGQLKTQMLKAKKENDAHRKKMDELANKKDAESQKKYTKMAMDLSRVMKVRNISSAMQKNNCPKDK